MQINCKDPDSQESSAGHKMSHDLAKSDWGFTLKVRCEQHYRNAVCSIQSTPCSHYLNLSAICQQQLLTDLRHFYLYLFIYQLIDFYFPTQAHGETGSVDQSLQIPLISLKHINSRRKQVSGYYASQKTRGVTWVLCRLAT